MSLLGGIVRAVRPKQWLKNVLVFAAPAAASVLDDKKPLVHSIGAFIAFCAIASSVYLLNDVLDVEADRRHPKKRYRPIARGAVPIPVALVVCVLALAFGTGLSLLITPRLTLVLGIYVGTTLLYTLKLKHVAVLDIGFVASGFVLRAIAGGVAAGVPISQWFLIVATFGSLFMVAGKRHAESLELGDTRGKVRATLEVYPLAYLRFVWMMAAAVTTIAYCLWAFEQAAETTASHFPWYQISIAPFVLGLLRYALLIETGTASAPEDVVIGDRTVQALGLVWMLTYGAGIYLGH